MKRAGEIEPGEEVLASDGWRRVLVSKPDPLSSGSAATTKWMLVLVAPGRPTFNRFIDPYLELEVR